MDVASPRVGRLVFAIALLLIGVGATAAHGARSEEAVAVSGNAAGTLAGTWAGVLTGSSGTLGNERIVIVVNADQAAGTWKLSTTCHGRLTLDSVSDGYHHYRRRLAPGATCAGGDVDCLMRVGTGLYDSVTPRAGGAALSGTLRRVRNH
jgi:hypothetical protein